MKKSIITVILLAMGMGVMAQSDNWSAHKAESFSQRTDKTITIMSEAELALLAYQVNEGETQDEYGGYTFQLGNDLDLSAHYWEPIGFGTEDEGNAFKGTFKGNGHTISGLYINKPEGTGVGLFGYIYNPARIENVKITSGSVTGNFLVGAIVGNYCGSPQSDNVGIFNCEVGADVTVKAVAIDELTGSSVGGIAGYMEYATISECISSATVEGDEYTGGIAGQLFGGEDESTLHFCIITECYNLGLITEGSETGYRAVCILDPNDALITITLLDDDRNAIVNNEQRIRCYDGTKVNVTIAGRTIWKDGYWNTLCLPFTLNDLNATPLEAANIMTFSSSSFKNGNLTLNFVKVGGIAAGRPCILKWDSDHYSPFSFSGVTIVSETADINTDDNIDFKGNYSPIEFTADGDKTILFLGADDKLFYPNGEMNINSFRSYFQLKNGLVCGEKTDNGINSFKLKFEEETTSLSEELRVKSEESAAGWYSLDGRQLSGKPKAKGIYIYHGHKVIVK